jgi:hypothetical protein
MPFATRRAGAASRYPAGSAGQRSRRHRRTIPLCRVAGLRKIFYQEKDSDVEPVADDLASLALDLLLGEAGFHRASGNPLLWQATPRL